MRSRAALASPDGQYWLDDESRRSWEWTELQAQWLRDAREEREGMSREEKTDRLQAIRPNCGRTLDPTMRRLLECAYAAGEVGACGEPAHHRDHVSVRC